MTRRPVLPGKIKAIMTAFALVVEGAKWNLARAGSAPLQPGGHLGPTLNPVCVLVYPVSFMTNLRRSSPRQLLAAALLAAFAAGQARASTRARASSGDPLSPAPGTSCVANERFVVVSRPGEGPGNDIIARQTTARGSTKACAGGYRPGDTRIARAGEAKYVWGLQGKFLILDEGTGPSIRKLVVVDLARGSEVWSVPYVSEPTPQLSPHGLFFVKYLRIAHKNDCPNAREIVLQGLTPLYVIEGELALPALGFTATGQPRCIAGQ